MNDVFKGFLIGAVSVFLISGSLIIISNRTDDEIDIDYNSRLWQNGIKDFIQVQLLMFPFNDNDNVTLQLGGEHGEIIYIYHTEPNPDFLPMKEVYNFTMNLGNEMTWEWNYNEN